MAEARTRSAWIRSRAAGLLAAGYALALGTFWVAGAAAYGLSGHGFSRLVGLAYFPILLLPIVGHGSLLGLRIHGAIWFWWFGLQMLLGATAIWLYPYEPMRRRHPRRARFGASRSGLPGDGSLVRMPQD
jgi:uncharacterized membrane protein YidH (DUF202 family)